jgi:hypothetical protein
MVYDDIRDILGILMVLFTQTSLLLAACMCVCAATPRTDVGGVGAATAATAATVAMVTNRRLGKSHGKYSPAWYHKTLETLETVSEVSAAEEAC